MHPSVMREIKEWKCKHQELQYLEFELYSQEYNIPELLIAPDKLLLSLDYNLPQMTSNILECSPHIHKSLSNFLT